MTKNKKRQTVIIVGLGEVGKPLFDIINEKYDAIGIDIEHIENCEQVDIMHICYSYQIGNFIGTTIDYISQFNPKLTIINSTVIPGTTRSIFKRTGKPIVHSPIRGKHIKMHADLLYYTKFIGGIDEKSAKKASGHFRSLGLKTKICSSPEITELAKLTETTYFGLLIAWAQEVKRYCNKLNVYYDDVVNFYDEIKFFPPVKYTPGFIDGHCVIPNVKLLKRIFESDILDAILKSNDKKAKELKLKGFSEGSLSCGQ